MAMYGHVGLCVAKVGLCRIMYSYAGHIHCFE